MEADVSHIIFIEISAPATPVINPCTIVCPAKIVRKMAHKYPAVPKIIAAVIISVSYTHLDVYKRQHMN